VTVEEEEEEKERLAEFKEAVRERKRLQQQEEEEKAAHKSRSAPLPRLDPTTRGQNEGLACFDGVGAERNGRTGDGEDERWRAFREDVARRKASGRSLLP
jgi:hypothetical protein